MKKTIKILIGLSFFIYAFVALYVLFIRFGGTDRLAKTEINYNLIPFKTINGFIKAFLNGSGFAFVNLFGNLFLMLPLGFYLPFYIKKLEKFFLYALFITALILIIEVLQLVTLTGTCDIDDFILNFTGAVLGFFVFKRLAVKLKIY